MVAVLRNKGIEAQKQGRQDAVASARQVEAALDSVDTICSRIPSQKIH